MEAQPQHAALAVSLDEGGTPHLHSPVPDLALVSLDVLLAARFREWLLVSGDNVQLCGHRFRIVGWTNSCLVFRHDGVA